MIEKISSSLTGYLIENGGNPEQREVYEYSISSFFSSLFTYAAILLFAYFLGILYETVVYLLFSLPLRYCIGGLHANTRLACFILSIVITIGLVMLTPYCNQYLFFLSPFVALPVVFFIAPVVNPKHPLSEAYIKKVKKTAKLVFFVEVIALVALYSFGSNIYYNVAAMGVLSSSVSSILAYMKYKPKL